MSVKADPCIRFRVTFCNDLSEDCITGGICIESEDRKYPESCS